MRAVTVPALGVDAAVCAGVALVLAGVAFGASGGTALTRTTVVEVLLMLGGAGLVATAILAPRADRPRRLYGAWPLAGLGALTVLTAVSITWSLAPGDSWVETNRMLAYLATFAGALALVRLAPERWPSVLGGVALGCVVVVIGGLVSKALPGTFAADETFARLRAPFGYWNATGLTCALAVPPLLWLAAKRSGNLAFNALAYPALGLCFVCLLLSYSRGALLALALGLVFWFAVVPLRLRAAVALTAAGLATVPVISWAFAREALTDENAILLARSQAGRELGALLLLMVALLTVVGLAVGFAAANRAPALRTRRFAGLVIGGLLAAAAIGAIVAVATKPGGIDGQVSKAYTQLTDPDAGTPDNSPQRLTATASVRSRYWREAYEIFAAEPVLGAGAGSFAVARTRYRTGVLMARQAHGYLAETMASLGVLGLAVSLALLVAWLAGAARVTGLGRRTRGVPPDAERIGLLTLCSVVLVFGLHSLIDWTWLVPGTAVIALLCAAWVVGRGDVAQGDVTQRTRASEFRPGEGDVAQRTSASEVRPGEIHGREAPYAVAPAWLRPLAATAVLLVALAAAWSAVQPLRSARASDVAYSRLDAGQGRAAVDIARIAVERNPLALEPRFALAAIQDATGDTAGAAATLERAVEAQPANANAWRRLGEYRALQLGQPKTALAPLRAAYYLDPQSPRTQAAFILFQRQLAAAPPGG